MGFELAKVEEWNIASSTIFEAFLLCVYVDII